MHELGHQLGLAHSNSWDCDGVPFDPGGHCQSVEYGNPYDTMGSLNNFHFNAAFKSQLGWLTPVKIDRSGTYVIHPLETSQSPVKALTVGDTGLILEYRRALGFDSLENSGRTPDFDGVLLNMMGNPSYSINVDPLTAPYFYDQRFIGPLLRLNKSYIEPTTGVRITVQSLTQSAATLAIDVPSPPIPKSSIQITSPLSGTEYSGDSPIVMFADATVPGGAAAKVEYLYRDGTDFKIGEAVQPPYRSDWTVFPSGSLITVVARLTTSAGLITQSAPVTFKILKAVSVVAARKPGLLPSQGWNIVSSLSNRCLTAGSGALTVHDCDGTGSQQFVTQDTGLGTYQIQSSADIGRCLDISGGSLSSGASLILWPCHSGDNQKFGIGGTPSRYQISGQQSGLCVEPQGKAAADGVALVQSRCDQTVAQAFLFSAKTSGSLRISTTSVPLGYKDEAYFNAFVAEGGAPPYSWDIIGGKLPFGLSLSTAGNLSGTPLLVNGFFNDYYITVQARDSVGAVTNKVFVARMSIARSQTAQTIVFGSLSNVNFGVAPFVISATATSGLAVTFTSNTTSGCTVSSVTVTLLAAGTCSITASQAGNATYAAAPNVTQTFTVTTNQTAQTITFGAPANQLLGVTVPALSATATSGLTVTFTSNTTSVCTVSSVTVTLLAAGACSITASQPGNTTYAAAPSVTQTFTVSPAAGTPAFFNGQVPLGGGVNYLQFPNGNLFGYYSQASSVWLFHYDFGYFSPIDAKDGNSGIYLYDNTSGHWFYTSAGVFPNMYDFTLNAWLYYFPDTNRAGHYTTSPRYFVNLTTKHVFTM